MRKLARIGIAVFIGLTLGVFALSALVAEGSLRIQDRPRPSPRAAGILAGETDSDWEAVRISAADGVPLEAWRIVPHESSGATVILLHGVGDTRLGMISHAQLLLRDGFAVLMPDARGHGSSGGDLTTYGIREAGDVHDWADWLFRERGGQRLYGLGESMGAGILLQALACEPRFRAVVAECPFATFEEGAGDRLSGSGLPRLLVWPVTRLGMLYARALYGLDFHRASPAAAVRATHVPVLLIHGALDANLRPENSRVLHAVNPATVLWEVPGAHHVDALSTRPALYRRTVTGWFYSHP
ncbi:MAG TPA: alpha/beta fold hydrolase [Bryobacteraceae bacterium]